ncbi:hypothetical protein C8R44DRAFT_747274 [Mycena epipterygia]|nr:hypothetical protein C8R44DRAFT_747274 [Mycena epipterygia]
MKQEGIRAAKERRDTMWRSADATWEMGEGRKGQRRWVVLDVEGGCHATSTMRGGRSVGTKDGDGDGEDGGSDTTPRRPTRCGADASGRRGADARRVRPEQRADRSHVESGQVRGKGSARKNGGWHIRKEGERTEKKSVRRSREQVVKRRRGREERYASRGAGGRGIAGRRKRKERERGAGSSQGTDGKRRANKQGSASKDGAPPSLRRTRERHDPPTKTAFASASASAFPATLSDIGNYAQSRSGNVNVALPLPAAGLQSS